MGRETGSRTKFENLYNTATRGGTTSATLGAERRLDEGLGLDPLVDPKGLPHLGPVRMSLPRFDQVGKFWRLTVGLPMPEETLFDTTASMGDNVDLAFRALPRDYDMLTSGSRAVLGRYDVQIATAIFNDVEDRGTALLARSQFEMADKIAEQLAMLPPGRDGCGNQKEDPQYGLFAAAYLTAPAILKWGLLPYHFTVSDEPIATRIQRQLLERLFGEDVLDRIAENGIDIDAADSYSTAETIDKLQERAHAFFLHVPGWQGGSDRVHDQWVELYGEDHVVVLPGSTEYLHYVKTIIIGLTEGVLDLQSAVSFLKEHELDQRVAYNIVEAVEHIDLGAQARRPGFNDIPMAGALFREKTDTEPLSDDEAAEALAEAAQSSEDEGPDWL
jgi:hypothetical protein